MSFSLLFVFALTGFLCLVTMVMFLIWRSYRHEGMLGGLLLMWSMIMIFLAIVFFTEKKSAIAEADQANQTGDSSSTSNFPHNTQK